LLREEATGDAACHLSAAPIAVLFIANRALQSAKFPGISLVVIVFFASVLVCAVLDVPNGAIFACIEQGFAV
jgi:hypothetical protein